MSSGFWSFPTLDNHCLKMPHHVSFFSGYFHSSWNRWRPTFRFHQRLKTENLSLRPYCLPSALTSSTRTGQDNDNLHRARISNSRFGDYYICKIEPFEYKYVIKLIMSEYPKVLRYFVFDLSLHLLCCTITAEDKCSITYVKLFYLGPLLRYFIFKKPTKHSSDIFSYI